MHLLSAVSPLHQDAGAVSAYCVYIVTSVEAVSIRRGAADRMQSCSISPSMAAAVFAGSEHLVIKENLCAYSSVP